MLLGLGLFVAGIVTGVTALYWVCVGACLVAAALLFVARRRLPASPQRTAPARTTSDDPQAVSAAESLPDGAPEAGGGHGASAVSEPPAVPAERGEPPVEEVEVTDLLLVVDLHDEVLVLDEHPRYHLAGCVHLGGRTAIPLPLDEARADGFTPCGACEPDRNLAEQERARKAASGG